MSSKSLCLLISAIFLLPVVLGNSNNTNFDVSITFYPQTSSQSGCNGASYVTTVQNGQCSYVQTSSSQYYYAVINCQANSDDSSFSAEFFTDSSCTNYYEYNAGSSNTCYNFDAQYNSDYTIDCDTNFNLAAAILAIVLAIVFSLLCCFCFCSGVVFVCLGGTVAIFNPYFYRRHDSSSGPAPATVVYAENPVVMTAAVTPEGYSAPQATYASSPYAPTLASGYVVGQQSIIQPTVTIAGPQPPMPNESSSIRKEYI